jgi:hypothetical protein
VPADALFLSSEKTPVPLSVIDIAAVKRPAPSQQLNYISVYTDVDIVYSLCGDAVPPRSVPSQHHDFICKAMKYKRPLPFDSAFINNEFFRDKVNYKAVKVAHVDIFSDDMNGNTTKKSNKYNVSISRSSETRQLGFTQPVPLRYDTTGANSLLDVCLFDISKGFQIESLHTAILSSMKNYGIRH